MKKRNVVLLVVAAFAILAVVAGLVLVFTLRGTTSVPAKTILEADFEQGVLEYLPADDPFAELAFKDRLDVRDVVEALAKGAGDERVVGLIARVGQGSGLGVAQIQEVRDAVIAFRQSGKPAFAYAETFGEVSPGNGAYYLATAFDKIFLQPAGDVNLTGLFLESPFVRGTLDKAGLTPRMDHRYEYKNAMDFYTEKEYTAAHREAMETVMNSIFGQMVDDIAGARRMEPDALRAVVDRGPYLGTEALEAGLVDEMAYRDEVYAELRESVGKDAELLFLKPYLARAGRFYDSGTTIALIYGVGGIQRGASSFDPLSGDYTMGSDTVAAAFRAAVDDDDVKAILFRLDCPGGSYVASDSVWRETVRARDAGKPVIVSMGNVAGSGGYFVAMDAAKIVAEPGTITASIGVLGGKFLTSGLWEKLGVSWDSVQTSENASIWTGTHDYTPAEWERFQAWLDRVYADFTARVAEGRKMPLEEVQKIAKGRIWTGADAKELGLVDALGGYPEALRLVREEAGLDADADIHLKVFPRPRSPFDALFGGGRSSSEARLMTVAMLGVFEKLRPAVEAARQAGLLEPQDQVLAMSPEWRMKP